MEIDKLSRNMEENTLKKKKKKERDFFFKKHFLRDTNEKPKIISSELELRILRLMMVDTYFSEPGALGTRANGIKLLRV